MDQRTFNPDAGKRPIIPPLPAPPVAPAADPAALLIVRFPQTGSLQADVAKAVAAARARKADVVFDVVEIVAEAGSGPLGQDAEEVARLITAQGVPANRVHLMLRAQPGAPGHEVRVYVH